MNNHTVIGVFDTLAQARSAKQALLAEGQFSESHIDISKYGSHGTVGDNFHEESNKVEGFFDRLFGTDDDDDRDYRRTDAAREVASRGTVVTVHTSGMEQARRASSVLDRYGAIDMDDRYQQYRNDDFDADRNRNMLNERYGDVDNANQTIEVVKEDVQIGKREVQTGGVTVRSHVIERPIEETLRLRTEEVFVDRHAVDRPATDADFRDQTISVKETAEEAMVSKQARVVEEINVGKKVGSREETIRETARETEVDVVKDEQTNLRDRNTHDRDNNPLS